MKPNFLYRIATLLARPAARIYFNKRTASPAYRNLQGPAVIACNHPNSFFDTVVQGAEMREPLHTVVRGDVFKKGLLRKIFDGLHMIPAYRGSEGGREHVLKNEEMFDLCNKVLKQGGVIVIYAEGICLHEYQLRPLKKGLARVAMQAWADPEIGDKFKVIPAGLNYTSFHGPGKSLALVTGEEITMQAAGQISSDAANLNRFNDLLESRMKPLVWPEEEVMKLKSSLHPFFKLLLSPFALLGWLLNAPLYFPVKKKVAALNRGGVFYDSMLFGFLMLLYPVYVMLLGVILATLSGEWWCLPACIALLPLMAKSAVIVKKG